jgi:hypothetical protein
MQLLVPSTARPIVTLRCQIAGLSRWSASRFPSLGPTRSRSGQFPAHLRHRHACPVSGDMDIGDRCEQGVSPEVIDLPPCHLIERVGLDSAAKCRCREHSEPELVILRPRNLRSGRNRSRIPSRGTESPWLAGGATVTAVWPAVSLVPWNVPPPAVRMKELNFAERPVAFLLAHRRAPRASRRTG